MNAKMIGASISALRRKSGLTVSIKDGRYSIDAGLASVIFVKD